MCHHMKWRHGQILNQRYLFSIRQIVFTADLSYMITLTHLYILNIRINVNNFRLAIIIYHQSQLCDHVSRIAFLCI